MVSSNPIRDGFATIGRQPLLPVAEIAWRWCFGVAFWAVASFSAFRYLDSLPVTPLSWLMWKTGLPPLMSQALSATIAGSGFKLLRLSAVLVPSLLLLWTFASAAGRTATLRALLPSRTVEFRTVLVLSFLRAALLLAGFASLLGVFSMAAQAYTDGPGTVSHPGRAITIFVLVGSLVCYFWSTLNWLLSLAPAVAGLSGADAVASISGAMAAMRGRTKHFLGATAAFGALHVSAFVVFTTIAFFSLGLVGILPGSGMLAVLAVITLAYFALVDVLYIARLAAYVSILDRVTGACTGQARRLRSPSHEHGLIPPQRV